MKTYKGLYIILALLLYPIIFYSRYSKIEILSKVLIPIFVTWVLAYVVVNYFNSGKKNGWLVSAFVFVCAGDYLINLTPYNQLSAVAFAGTHVCLSIFYISNTSFSKRNYKWIIIPIFISLISLYFAFNYFTKTYLLVIFITYLAILSFMFWRALSYLDSALVTKVKVLVVLGSLFFFLTDIFVCMQVLHPQKIFISLTWILYPPALLMLSLQKIGNFNQESETYEKLSS